MSNNATPNDRPFPHNLDSPKGPWTREQLEALSRAGMYTHGQREIRVVRSFWIDFDGLALSVKSWRVVQEMIETDMPHLEPYTIHLHPFAMEHWINLTKGSGNLELNSLFEPMDPKSLFGIDVVVNKFIPDNSASIFDEDGNLILMLINFDTPMTMNRRPRAIVRVELENEPKSRLYLDDISRDEIYYELYRKTVNKYGSSVVKHDASGREYIEVDQRELIRPKPTIQDYIRASDDEPFPTHRPPNTTRIYLDDPTSSNTYPFRPMKRKDSSPW